VGLNLFADKYFISFFKESDFDKFRNIFPFSELLIRAGTGPAPTKIINKNKKPRSLNYRNQGNI
jgi:hypothetical protein